MRGRPRSLSGLTAAPCRARTRRACPRAQRPAGLARRRGVNPRIALLALVTACWTQGPAPAPPMRPEPSAAATATKPVKTGPRWRRSAARPPDPPSPTTRAPIDLARELAAQLRAGGTHLLPSFVAGPIVTLDLDSGAL